MSTRVLSLLAIALWVVTIAVAATFFIRGQTATAPDGRTSVMLKGDERDLVLGEMRLMLEGVQGIVAGVAANDAKAVASAARGVGAGAAADVNPALMAKLPLDFKQRGMTVHGSFDELAAAIEQGTADNNAVLLRLAEQLNRCIACHATYRLDSSTATSP